MRERATITMRYAREAAPPAKNQKLQNLLWALKRPFHEWSIISPAALTARAISAASFHASGSSLLLSLCNSHLRALFSHSLVYSSRIDLVHLQLIHWTRTRVKFVLIEAPRVGRRGCDTRGINHDDDYTFRAVFAFRLYAHLGLVYSRLRAILIQRWTRMHKLRSTILSNFIANRATRIQLLPFTNGRAVERGGKKRQWAASPFVWYSYKQRLCRVIRSCCRL